MIKVNFAQLSQASDDLGAVSRKIQAELDELEQKLKPLVETWGGGAMEAYRGAQVEWDNAAREMVETAAKMGVAVNTANEAYQAGEKKNVGRF